MDESICPVCRKDTLDYYVSGVEGEDDPLWYECMNGECMFRCTQKYLDRVVAAMELARAELAWDDYKGMERVNKALSAVREVFGGE